MITLSQLGSDDAEEPEILQTRTDTDGNTDGMRAGSDRTSAQPGGTSILLGPPRSLHTTLRNSMEVKKEKKPPQKNKKTLNPPTSLVLVGRGRQHTAFCIPGSLSRAHLANMWLPLPSQGLCKAIFIHRMVGGRGSLLRTPQPYAGGRGWRGLPGRWAGFGNPAVC